MSLIIRILANSAAILVASKLVPGFIFTGSYLDLIIAGAVLGIINALVGPILKLISFPIIFLTLGLFNVVINIFLLLLADRFLLALDIRTFAAAFWGIIILSTINHLMTHFSKQNE